MAKKPAAKKMTLKKATTKGVPKANPYVVRVGTRNELGPERTFQTEVAARSFIIAELNSWVPWCTRHNQAGLVAIAEAKDRVPSITFHRDPARIECCFDEHYGMWIVAEFWSSRP